MLIIVESGDIFVGNISSYNEHQGVFYIVEDGSEDMINIIIELKQEIWWIPTLYEKFILISDGLPLRGTRVPLDDELDSKRYMKLFLLDTGESFNVPILYNLENSIYEMPPELIHVPALALKSKYCKIEVDHHYESDSEFVKNNLYRKFTFEVTKGGSDLLEVIIHPYYEDEIEADVKYDLSDVDQPEEHQNVNIEKITMQNHNDDIPKNEMKLTEKDIEIFYEEPLNTHDPVVAVQGFKTHDDDRVCKFYDSITGACWKKGHCKLRHVKEIQDGTCTDKKELYFNDIAKRYPLPALHSEVKIEITKFKNATSFYCRYVKSKLSKDQPTLEELTDHMNHPDEIVNYKPLTDHPSFSQLVLVKSEGMFCRARVQQLDDNESRVEVLLVDFGYLETFQIKKIYHWCPRFNYLPFQTVEMQIANIQSKDESFDQAAIDRMEIYLKESQKSYLKARIFDNVGVIKCRLFNSEDEDLGEKLVSEGFVLPKALQFATPETVDYYIPA